MHKAQIERNMVTGEWCTVYATHPEESVADLTVCAAPYHTISVADEGDDMLGVRIPITFDAIADLIEALEAFRKLPAIEAEITWEQEKRHV